MYSAAARARGARRTGSRRAARARTATLVPDGKCPGSVSAVSHFHGRRHFTEVVGSEHARVATSARRLLARLARAPAPGSSVVDYLMSGTPWVPPALFDTHGVPLVVTVVEMSAIGGRGERRLAEFSGGRAVVPDGSAALASFALHPSAHLVTERVRRARGCRAKAARGGRCRRRGGRQGAGSGARAAATPVSAGGRRRQGTAGECESREVGGNRPAAAEWSVCGCGGYRCPRQGMSCGTT